jgi:TATA-box binding protein (TBP) (component of TFIID and TFIIIB)
MNFDKLIPQTFTDTACLEVFKESEDENEEALCLMPPITVGELTTHNVLAHADTHCSINLKQAVRIFPCSEYDPSKFQSVRIKLEDGSVSVFSTGKLQITGARSVAGAKSVLKKVAYRLKQKLPSLKSNVKFSSFRAENILATMDLGFPVNLVGLSRDPLLVTAYEPSRFAAVVIRDPGDTKVTVDVFSSGKVNLKGGVSVENLCSAVNKCLNVIAKYQVR